MDELAEKNYVVVDHFLDQERLNIIQSFFRSHLDNFIKAGKGALPDHMVRPDIREITLTGLIEKGI